MRCTIHNYRHNDRYTHVNSHEIICTIKLLFTASIDLCICLHQVNQLLLARVDKNIRHAHILAFIHTRYTNRIFTMYRSNTNTV